MPFDPYAATYNGWYARFDPANAATHDYWAAGPDRFARDARWEKLQRDRLDDLIDSMRLHMRTKGGMPGGGTETGQTPDFEGKGKMGRSWSRFKAKVDDWVDRGFGTGEPDEDYNPYRRTTPRQGRTTANREAGGKPNGQGGFRLPLIEPPKRTTPGAPREQRLGALGKQSNNGAGGGWSASHNRSGFANTAGSYHERSALRLAQSTTSRVRLTRAGFWALQLGEIGNAMMDAANRDAKEAGTPGGFLMLPNSERSAATMKVVGDDPTRFARRNANGLAQVFIGAAAMALQGSYQLNQLVPGLGGALGSSTPIYVGMMKNLMKMGHYANAWAEGGWEGAMDMATIIEEYGSPEQYDLVMATNAKIASMHKGRRRFLSDVANDIAMEVVGVNGTDILDELIQGNDYAAHAFEAGGRVKDRSGFWRIGHAPDPSLRYSYGTRD